MIKLNFFRVSSIDDFGMFTRNLANNSSKKIEDKNGFQTISFDEKHFSGTFFDKNIYRNEIIGIDNEKKEIYYEYFNIINFTFLLEDKNTYLVLSNPPRSIRSLLEFFANEKTFNLNINTIELNLEKFSNCFINEFYFQILKVKFTNIHISKESIATIDIISSSNALTDFKDVFTSPSFKFKKIKFSYDNNHEKIIIEATNNGAISITENFYNESETRDLAKIINNIINA
ncbi:hypothetical protein [Acinetobacter modestus]|uniref:hypothetical protein n=1 Tax=Acinetobacter modestus TaxID=1776740 RepID=UPI003016F3F7